MNPEQSEAPQSSLKAIKVYPDQIHKENKVNSPTLNNSRENQITDTCRFNYTMDDSCSEYVEEIENAQNVGLSGVDTHVELKDHKDVSMKLDNSLKDSMKDREAIMNKLRNNKENFELFPIFVYKDGYRSNKFDYELIERYPNSYYYKKYKNNQRTENGEISIDYDHENEDFLIKYMNNDKSLFEDIQRMSLKGKCKFLEDLHFFNIYVEIQMINVGNEDKDIRVIENNKEIENLIRNTKYISKELRQKNIIMELYRHQFLKDIYYDKEGNQFFIVSSLRYANVIERYLKNNRQWNNELIEGIQYYNELINEFESLGIKLSDLKISNLSEDDFSFVEISNILDNIKYDKYLKEWLGNKYEWRCIYRASEHRYTGESFHKYCDNVGPTLIIIKSHNGYIFGGYTTKSWRKENNGQSWEDKVDNDAFLFTLYNPHGVVPTKYNALKDKGGISCYSNRGPIFCCKDNGDDLCLNYFGKNCNEDSSCYIANDGNRGYECDPQYKRSLFINTAGSDDFNLFSVSDYEVFAIRFKDLDMVMKRTEYSYDIPEMKSNKQRLNTLSEILNETKIVDARYYKYLKQWLGNEYKWKLIYRASEHGYTAKSFHEYCDDVGPTLIIIKSHNGYIFGGYTTKSWSGDDENVIDNDAFLFTLYNAHGVSPTYYNAWKNRGGISCNPDFGPIFCNTDGNGWDICINYDDKNSNDEDSCLIQNDSTGGYECNPQYKISLFVNTNGPDDTNWFSIDDYEVFAHI